MNYYIIRNDDLKNKLLEKIKKYFYDFVDYQPISKKIVLSGANKYRYQTSYLIKCIEINVCDSIV